jgi:hypothetical protein
MTLPMWHSALSGRLEISPLVRIATEVAPDRQEVQYLILEYHSPEHGQRPKSFAYHSRTYHFAIALTGPEIERLSARLDSRDFLLNGPREPVWGRITQYRFSKESSKKAEALLAANKNLPECQPIALRYPMAGNRRQEIAAFFASTIKAYASVRVPFITHLPGDVESDLFDNSDRCLFLFPAQQPRPIADRHDAIRKAIPCTPRALLTDIIAAPGLIVWSIRGD